MYIWKAPEVRDRWGCMSTSGCAREKSYSSSRPRAVLAFSPIFLKMLASSDLRSADTGVAATGEAAAG